MAERAIEDLADLFRGGMRRADRLIPLEEELSLARKYLDLEQRRLGDRLQVSWRVEDLPPGARVLPMVLQPLLENAVAHGVQNRPGGGQIELYGRQEEDRIVVTITNPVGGPALSEGRAEAHHGMALRNIRQRLELAWGDRASLITQQDDEQFFAVVTLPYVERTDHR